MGCVQSRHEAEVVSRCKERKNLMKEVVSERKAFAAGHHNYVASLKSTGAALGDYGHGEVVEAEAETEEQQSFMASTDSNFHPPPPPPNFSPSPLIRASTMPEFLNKPNIEPIAMCDFESESVDGGNTSTGKDSLQRNRHRKRRDSTTESPLPPPSPPPPPITVSSQPSQELKAVAWDFFFTADNMSNGSGVEEDVKASADKNVENEEIFAQKKSTYNHINDSPSIPEMAKEEVEGIYHSPARNSKKIPHLDTVSDEVKEMGNTGSNANLVRVLGVIDDHFLKASESAKEVSKILEANRMHYHSNFGDNRGYVDHSERVMRVITWNNSTKENVNAMQNDFHFEEFETLATVLEKLLAWEKKLYDEVKAAEFLKAEYQRKISVLNKQKKHGLNSQSLGKTKASLAHLHTRYVVDMQSLDSTISEVTDLRDNQFYPKLVSLIDESGKMWEAMWWHHEQQLKASLNLKSLEVPHPFKETTKQHNDSTVQLLKVLEGWSSNFEDMVAHQKSYVKAMNAWMKLNIIPVESGGVLGRRASPSSPTEPQNRPIHFLVQSWAECVHSLPDESTKASISFFTATVKAIALQQEEEMRQRQKWEETRKEYVRKSHALGELFRRSAEKGDEGGGGTDQVKERRFMVESLKKKVEEEGEEYQRQCTQVREKSLVNLKTCLPELFKAMVDYSTASFQAYQRLRFLSQPHGDNGR